MTEDERRSGSHSVEQSTPSDMSGITLSLGREFVRLETVLQSIYLSMHANSSGK